MCFSPNIPKPADPPPPPKSSQVSSQAKAAMQAQGERAAKRKGVAGTVATSGMGVFDRAKTSAVKLLGGN